MGLIHSSRLVWIVSSREALWYNGCCESLIGYVKKCLRHAIGGQKMTYSELQTLLFEANNLVTERPIGKIPTTPEDGSYLCPSDILLGRASIKEPSENFDTTNCSRKCIYFVQRMIDIFWKKWTTFYFASLTLRRKWHHEQRNLEINDIVIIYDKDLHRGQWKIGIVSKVFSGRWEIHHVNVKYKNPESTQYIEIERPVHKLVVLLTATERDVI